MPTPGGLPPGRPAAGTQMIIEQSRADAGGFPHTQAWWQRFMPCWVTVTVRDDGYVILDPGPEPDHAAELQEWIDQFPRIACAVIDDDDAPYGLEDRKEK
jgi:hypothetical protein